MRKWMRMMCLAMGLTPVHSGADTLVSTKIIGDLGNAPDPMNTNSVPSIGTVNYGYSIGTAEILNGQYAYFLNYVAATDTYGLYNTSMSSDARGGITRTGSPGSYLYDVKPNMDSKPVNYVSYYDAVRFANWMANGQPFGGQTNGVTETGSYTLTGATTVGSRNANASWVIPTENEWYKAAYYDPGPSGPADDYWLYPTRSDSVPTVSTASSSGNISNPGANVANYGSGADWNSQDGNVTTPGSAGALSASYYGTFDQGGNVNEWTETILGSFQVLRGGGWANSEAALRSTTQGFDSPTVEDAGLGFRLALIPEPGPIAVFALLGLAALAHRIGRTRRGGTWASAGGRTSFRLPGIVPTASLAFLVATPSDAAVIAPLVSGFSTQPPSTYVSGSELVITSIVGVSGMQIHILEIGIGGDADANSGPTRFSLDGGGIALSWAAGQASSLGQAGVPTFVLPPTPNAGWTARGFSTQAVDYLADLGASVFLYWDQHYDWDGHYTLGTDTEGNFYDDASTPSSIRAYVRYEMLAIPEPWGVAWVLLGILGALMIRRQRATHNAR